MRSKNIPVKDLPLIISAVELNPISEVAKRWGCTEKGIRGFLRHHYKAVSVIQHEHILKQIPLLLGSGLSKKAVAIKLGLSAWQVRTKYDALYVSHTLPVKDLDKIVTMLQTKPLNAVADLYDVDRCSIARYVQRHGYTYKQIVCDYRTKFINDHLDKGMKKKDIAKLLDISANQLYISFKDGVYT